jgi:hypothetical protein
MAEESPMETASYLNQWHIQDVSYMQRDLLLYAIGIGCTELKFVYEDDEDFAAFPTYPLMFQFKGTDSDVRFICLYSKTHPIE